MPALKFRNFQETCKGCKSFKNIHFVDITGIIKSDNGGRTDAKMFLFADGSDCVVFSDLLILPLHTIILQETGKAL